MLLTQSAVDETSYHERPAAGLESSQASLNKRFASQAGLDDGQPTDFKFLCTKPRTSSSSLAASAFEECQHSPPEPEVASAAQRMLPPELATLSAVQWTATLGGTTAPTDFRFLLDTAAPPARQVDSGTSDGDHEAQSKGVPASFDENGHRWLCTPIARGADLVDGKAWIAEFQRQLAKTTSDRPGGAAQRNQTLRDLVRNCGPPGRQVRLANGQEVIFWFNVGPVGPPRSRVFVTEARCPHQGVCLLSGELADVEDAHGIPSATIRCPRHNKAFDIRTGKSLGNIETLKCFPCRFAHGRWYVGIELECGHNESEPLSPLTPTCGTPTSHLQGREPLTSAKVSRVKTKEQPPSKSRKMSAGNS